MAKHKSKQAKKTKVPGRDSRVAARTVTPTTPVRPPAGLAHIAKRRSRLHGWGVFALEPIAKNKRIIAYVGEKISHAESLKRERRYIKNGHIWCFKLNNRWVIDASVGGNNARFVNHSCAPNCYTQIVDGTVWIRAARTIEAGDELTYNYYTDGEGLIQCRCRPGCKSLI